MIQPVVVAALAAVVGGTLAIAARDGRIVALGLLLSMIAAPLAASPEPTALAVGFRALGSLLAAYLLWAAVRAQSVGSEGSGVGLVAEVAAAAAAFSIGWFVAPVKPLAGPLAAQAAGVSLVVLAIVPLTGRDVFRAGAGAAVLVIGGSLLLEAWVGSPSSMGQMALTVLLVAIAGATSLLISRFDAPAARRTAVAGESASEPAPSEQSAAGAEAEEAPVAAAVAAPAARKRRPGATPGKVARATGPASAAPEPPENLGIETPRIQAPGRTSTIRTWPYRPLRTGGWTGPAEPIGGVTPDDETAPEPLEPSTETAPPASRVRRLRPREPRR
jgi:hypothetical protein